MKVAFIVFAMIVAGAAASAVVRPAYSLGYGGYGGYVAGTPLVGHSYYTPSYYHAAPVVYHQPVVRYVSSYGHHGYGYGHAAYPAVAVSPYYGVAGVAPWIKKK